MGRGDGAAELGENQGTDFFAQKTRQLPSCSLQQGQPVNRARTPFRCLRSKCHGNMGISRMQSWGVGFF